MKTRRAGSIFLKSFATKRGGARHQGGPARLRRRFLYVWCSRRRIFRHHVTDDDAVLRKLTTRVVISGCNRRRIASYLYTHKAEGKMPVAFNGEILELPMIVLAELRDGLNDAVRNWINDIASAEIVARDAAR